MKSLRRFMTANRGICRKASCRFISGLLVPESSTRCLSNGREAGSRCSRDRFQRINSCWLSKKIQTLDECQYDWQADRSPRDLLHALEQWLCLPILRVEPGGGLQRLAAGFALIAFDQQLAKIGVGRGEIGTKADRVTKRRNGRRPIIQVHQRMPQIVVGIAEIGLELDCPSEFQSGSIPPLFEKINDTA